MTERELINSKCREDWERLIKSWVHNEMDRKMLERRLLDGVHFENLAFEFDLSVVQCQTRVKNAKEQLFKNI